MATDTSWTQAGRDQFVDDGLERARAGLTGLIAKHLPGISADEAADILLKQPDHPDYEGLVAALDEELAAAASGHSPGITADERESMGGNSVMPDYLLGSGDQQVYSVMRDSNLLNAVVGRRPVKNADELRAGKTYLTNEDGQMVPPTEPGWFNAPTSDGQAQFMDRYRLANAGHDYHSAEQAPERHSTLLGSPYPQHQILGDENSPANAWYNSGDGVLGNAIMPFVTWPEASKRASRRDEPDIIPGAESLPGMAINTVGKWAKNIGGELFNANAQGFGYAATNRGSPMVPEGVTDPEMRADSIENVRDAASSIEAPDVHTYGASKGLGYSPTGGWLMDMGHEFADPLTPAFGVAGGTYRAAANFAKGGGRGILGGLVREIPKAIANEGAEEASSPLNYGVGALSYPWQQVMSQPTFAGKIGEALTAPVITGEEQAAAKKALEQQQSQNDQHLRNLKSVRGDY